MRQSRCSLPPKCGLPPSAKSVACVSADDGIVQFPAGCAELPGTGAQGFHWINNDLVDGTVELLRPELVMYEPKPGGGRQLVGVDYVVPLSLSAEPPTLLGVPFAPLPELGVPNLPAYLLVDVDRGEEFRGVAPEDALPVIRSRGRTPLTIDEGIALATQAPHLLEKNNCFMLSGSRRNDRRVPALWISSNAPKLGWCWDGNPHDWLGVASGARRLS